MTSPYSYTVEQYEELESEIVRLRELLAAKVGSSIRVELPGKDNGWKCYVTCQREKDEERIAVILAKSINMLCHVVYEIERSRHRTESDDIETVSCDDEL